MTRIIAGVAGGRRLVTAAGRGTRPTSDRTREGLFGTPVRVPAQASPGDQLVAYLGRHPEPLG